MRRLPVPCRISLSLVWERRYLNGMAILGVALGVFPLLVINGVLRGFHGRFIATILTNNAHVTLSDKEAFTPKSSDDSPLVSRSHSAPEARKARIARPMDVVASIDKMAGAEAASAGVVGTAILAFGAHEVPVELRGVDPWKQEAVTPLRSNLIFGDFDEFAGASDGALLGSELANALGASVGDLIVCVTAAGQSQSLVVSGIYQTGVIQIDRNRAYLPLSKAQSILDKINVVDRVEVRITDPYQADGFANRLERVFGLDAESWQDQSSQYLGLFAQQRVTIGLVIAALLLVGGFGILAIQVMIVLEKRRDIGILRSLGFRRLDVMTVFLLQGTLVGALGAALGSVAGHYAIDILRHTKVTVGMVYFRQSTWVVEESAGQYFLAAGFAILVGLVASLAPAWQASRIEPIDVLRGQQ